MVRKKCTQTYDVNEIKIEELERVLNEQQKQDALNEDKEGGKEGSNGEATVSLNESEGVSSVIADDKVLEILEGTNTESVVVIDDEVKSKDSMDDENTEKKEIHRLILKTEKDFRDGMEEIKMIKSNLLDQLQILGEEKRVMDEASKQLEEQHKQFKQECENYEVNKKSILEKIEDKNEFSLIQEAVERNVEALLGIMTETSFELADILEETDKTLEMYKSDNDDLRQKLQKLIEMIKEKNEEIDEQIDEAATLSTENEKLKEELIMLKTKDK